MSPDPSATAHPAVVPTSPVRLYIFGAAGSGTSTLGQAIAASTGWLHLDADDFYWKPTPQPYTEKHPPAARVAAMQARMQGEASWVISGGSLYDWGAPLLLHISHAVFLRLDDALRMARLHARETARFGDALVNDPVRHQVSQAFFAWAAGYETGDDGARSLQRHQRFLQELHCPVLQLDSAAPVAALRDAVLGFVRQP